MTESDRLDEIELRQRVIMRQIDYMLTGADNGVGLSWDAAIEFQRQEEEKQGVDLS